MIDLCNQGSNRLISVDEALENIKHAIQVVTDSETIPIQNAGERILSKPVYSPIDIPFENNSAMDGYGFSSDDCVGGHTFSLKLAGSSRAGHPFKGELQPGQCIRVFTGAALPPQVDSVVMQEQVQADGPLIRFPANTTIHHNMRAAGEDIKQGELICASPKKLSVYDLALLASAGVTEVTVKRKIRIAYFSTGDELISVGETLESGKIYDSNRYLLGEFLKDASFSIEDRGVIGDDKALLQRTLIDASCNHDVIITTGGASVGEADFVTDVLASIGQVNFWKLAIKPGKPLAFGKIGASYFFGLPGNPIAVVVTFLQIVSPALHQLSGAPTRKTLRFTAICTDTLKKSPGRMEFQRGILSQDELGQYFVASAGLQGSHILGSMSRANCFIILPADCSGIQAGAYALVEPFDHYY